MTPAFETNVKTVLEALKECKKLGVFCSHEEAQELPTTIGLEVNNLGPISLPLDDFQANRLVEMCQQAPFGKDNQTLVDLKVRDSFQLDPSQVKITHPDWEQQLEKLVERVRRELGCPSKVKAKLYKMLIYRQGGHFVKHQDTQKDPNMFGTLVIQPPSRHTGGELVVYAHDGTLSKIADFGQSTGKAPFACHYAAHYADLEHELRTVTSGYRLALVYLLCSDSKITKSDSSMNRKPKKCAKIEIDTNEKLVNAFKALNSSQYGLGLILEHEYTKKTFEDKGVEALKGK